MPGLDLRELIAAQSRDDQTWRLHRHEFSRREVRACDLDTTAEPGRGRRVLEEAPTRGLDALAPWEVAAMRAAKLADTRERVGPLVGFTPTWAGSIVLFDPAHGQPCAGCGGVQGRTRLRGDDHCVVCSSTRRHPVQEPHQRIEDKWDPGRRAKLGLPPLRARVKRRLKGGVGTASAWA